MGEWLGMILQRIGQAIFWIVEACGILLISLSVVLLFLLTLAKLKSGTWHTILQCFGTICICPT